MASPPTKDEVANMIVLEEMGETYKSIARMLGRSNHTVKKYLNSEAYLTDPAVKELVAVLKAKEIEDLRLLGGKARAKLHGLLDGDKVKIIEVTAVMDRSFQQRRLLEGESTKNISTIHVVRNLEDSLKRIDEELDKLPKQDS
jgi:predicted transcriptional regulator